MPTLSRAGSTGTLSRAGLDDMAADLWYQNRLANFRMAPSRSASTGTRTPSWLSSEWEPLLMPREPSVGSYPRTASVPSVDLDDWMGYRHFRYGGRTIDTQ